MIGHVPMVVRVLHLHDSKTVPTVSPEHEAASLEEGEAFADRVVLATLERERPHLVTMLHFRCTSCEHALPRALCKYAFSSWARAVMVASVAYLFALPRFAEICKEMYTGHTAKSAFLC